MIAESEIEGARLAVEEAAALSESTARQDILDEETGGGAVVFSRSGDPAEVVYTDSNPETVGI